MKSPSVNRDCARRTRTSNFAGTLLDTIGLMATTTTCLNCGEYVRLADRFCSRCGTELTLGTHATALLSDGVLPGDDPESPWIEVLHRLRRATLGEFEVGRELGRGGMAAVFLAHEIALDRKVAIKVMSPGLLMGDGMIERFKREAITIAHLNHPNIVSCYSVRQAEGLHFFVMRYIRGRSLEQLIHSAARIPAPIVRSILCQVGSALTYAHRSRVVHRDIKPANILVDIDGSAVVTDFGIAKVAELPGHTHTGALVGTPSYMSPEQCSGAEVSGASDQYSLGAVAYEMVTGAPPFTGSTLTVMQAQVEEAPPPIRDRVPECPPELEAAILRMLAKDPADRFPSMAEAKVALGATPLLEDDPLLAELSRLAGADSIEADVEAPQSPVPSRASAVRPTGLTGVARSIVILPPPAELAVGDGFALVALVRGERSVPLPGRPIEWSTDSSGVLHIDRMKQVATAVSPGTVWLTARCDEIESRVQVRVPPALVDAFAPALDEPAAAIRISSPPKSVRTGDSFFLTAVPLDQAGEPLLEPTVLWNTSDVRVAVVTAEGWVAALGRGQVLLTATRGGASASVTIDVEQAIPPSRPLWREAPVRAEPLADDPHRSGWRRRGTRTRRLVAQGLVSGLAVAGSLYLFGGLRDFRADRDRLTALAADYMEPVATDTSASTAGADSIPAINRGTAAPGRLIRRARRQPAAQPADSAGRMSPADTAAADSARIGGTAGEADAGQAPAMETELQGDRIYPDTSAYVPLTPELGRDAADEPPAAAPLRAAKPALPPVDRAKLESLLRDGVEDCYAALRSKDVDRVEELYRPETLADREKMRRLTRILRTEPWKAVVGRRVDGARELGARAAAAEFSLRLEWRDAMGGRLSSTPIFRAEFGRRADGWTMSSCRIVGSPKL